MRFLDVTMFYTAESGGVRTYLTAKQRWLEGQPEIEHIVVAPAGIEGRGAHFVGVPSVPIPYANGYRMPLSVRLAAHKMARLRPDLIEVGDPYHFAWAALRVKQRSNVPVVGFCHSDLPRLVERRFGPHAQRVALRYFRDLYRRFDLVLAPSQVMVRYLRELGVAHARHQPLGVDIDTFSPQHRDPDIRSRLGVPADTRLLLYAGRFTREKQLPLLVEAVRRLGPPYRLVLVGSGGVVPHCERVICVPFQPTATLARLIASCDVLVHPGDQETFGLVVLEAMASGRPVVGTHAGGIGELIDDATGVRVEPRSAEALAAGIEAIFERDLDAMGRAARAKVLAQFGWDRIIPQLMHQYAGVLGTQQQFELGLDPYYAPD
ncbi:glycosyltransferase family 1 protein [Oxalobacteraceae bacterium OM1]|nr:glycosyltransferase family 1 protein [Oxalobacteraceae bacterium OM1]